MIDGQLRAGQKIVMIQTGVTADLLEVGAFRPKGVQEASLEPGEVGYIATGLKSVADCRVGDTVTDASVPRPRRLMGTSRSSRWSTPAFSSREHRLPAVT